MEVEHIVGIALIVAAGGAAYKLISDGNLVFKGMNTAKANSNVSGRIVRGKRFMGASEAISLLKAGRHQEVLSSYMTEHFKWSEFFKPGSRASTAQKIAFALTRPYVFQNGVDTAKKLEQIRTIFGNRPVTIYDWMRVPGSVGNSSPTSHHFQGTGVDFGIQGYTFKQIYDKLVSIRFPGEHIWYLPPCAHFHYGHQSTFEPGGVGKC